MVFIEWRKFDYYYDAISQKISEYFGSGSQLRTSTKIG